jgi:hypothetical protein
VDILRNVVTPYNWNAKNCTQFHASEEEYSVVLTFLLEYVRVSTTVAPSFIQTREVKNKGRLCVYDTIVCEKKKLAACSSLTVNLYTILNYATIIRILLL